MSEMARMARMGRYCKAYPIARFREFQGWAEKTGGFQEEKKIVDGKEAGGQAAGKSLLYLQENYVVTDGIFMDEHIVFDDVTPEWMDFCKSALKFEAPVYEDGGKEEIK